jgi:hypothetical protein
MFKKITLLSMMAVLLLVQACSGMVQAQEAQSPVEVAEGFYDWYLGYIGDPATDSFRNPMSDGAYRDSGYLSAAFVAELDAMVAEGLAFDPVLMAQDIPSSFSVEAGSEAGTAVVHLQFGDYGENDLLVSLVEEDSTLKISGISRLD